MEIKKGIDLKDRVVKFISENSKDIDSNQNEMMMKKSEQ